MSEMEMFFGTVKRYVGPPVEVEDTDDFYEFERSLGHSAIVEVNGELWCIDRLEEITTDDFTVVIKPPQELMFLGHWYNGGGGLHEASAGAIRRYLEGVSKRQGDS